MKLVQKVYGKQGSSKSLVSPILPVSHTLFALVSFPNGFSALLFNPFRAQSESIDDLSPSSGEIYK